MVKDVRAAAQIRGKISYTLTDSEKASTVFRRSVFAVKDIAEGEPFTSENIRVIRPGYGMQPKYLHSMLGKTAPNAISRGTPLPYIEDSIL